MARKNILQDANGEQVEELKRKKQLPFWIIYLLPSMLIFILFVIYPFIKTIITSFFATSNTGALTQMIGFSNYISLFTSETYLHS